MRLRSMDPYDEPLWWRWPVVVEMRLIVGDFKRAWIWLRLLPWRVGDAIYSLFPRWWYPCRSCGQPVKEIPLATWKNRRRWNWIARTWPALLWCPACRRAEQLRQAEEFNEALDLEVRRLELMKKWQSLPPAVSRHQEQRRDQQFRDLLGMPPEGSDA